MTATRKKATNGMAMKEKGSNYERELAAYFNERVFDGKEVVFRTPLSGGGMFRAHRGSGIADLIGTPSLWVEAKRTERFSPHEAMAQAKRGIEANETPDLACVITRRNRMKTGESLVVMTLDDFVEIYSNHLRKIGDI